MYGINVSCKYLCRGGHGLQLYPTNNDTRPRGNLGVQCSIVSTCMCDGCRVFGLPIVMPYATQFAEANDRRYYSMRVAAITGVRGITVHKQIDDKEIIFAWIMYNNDTIE